MMELNINTPTMTHKHAVVWVEISTPVGEITIQPGHEPTILSLIPRTQVFYRLTTGKQESFTITQGIAHVTRTCVTLLIA